MSPLLSVSGLDKRFGGLRALSDVAFDVAAGEILGVIGPNGAGKTTLFSALTGLVRPDSGSVRLDGRDVTGAPAHALARAGLGFVPQTDNVFTRLSIRENLLVAAELLPRPARVARVAAMLAMFPDLGQRPHAPAGALSGGQRQMLAAARALLPEPRVLILDEPSAGLSPKLVAQVFDTLARIARAGVTLVLVEQNVRAALALADRAVVLVDGRLAHDGPARDLVGSPLLGRLFLGGVREAAPEMVP